MSRSTPIRTEARASVPTRKFVRLLAYLEDMGQDAGAVAAAVGLDRAALARARPEQPWPALYYGLLYNETVHRVQQGGLAQPWGAGIGGSVFRLMAHCLIDCRTLGEALDRAAEFDALVSPRLKGDRVSLLREGDGVARLVYRYRLLRSQQRFVPRAMRDTVLPLAIGPASGLTVWHAFCGWLTGRALGLSRVGIAAPVLPARYADKLRTIFHCPVDAVVGDSWIEFPAANLDVRIVQDAASLADLLRTGPYQLMRMDATPASTSAAIRSLLGTRFSEGVPGFEEIAARLGMSASSLRRRLMSERTSYQKLKDECRRDAAIRLLQEGESSVADIGERLGFTETSSFIRSFRGWTGTTPRAFRERLKKGDRFIFPPTHGGADSPSPSRK
jgi:AraC-like DNA-binding protein